MRLDDTAWRNRGRTGKPQSANRAQTISPFLAADMPERFRSHIEVERMLPPFMGEHSFFLNPEDAFAHQK